MASPPPADGGHAPSDPSVKKCGYLRKQKHGHKRFFVLRGPAEGCAPRLEYYESEKKWRNRAAARRVVALDSCLNINKRADAKHKHLIALYTRDEYFAVAAESEQEQESWFRVFADVVSEGRACAGGARAHSASALVGFDEESYGVIAAGTGAGAYREVWQVNVKPRGLGQSRNLAGVHRLCLSSRALSFVKLNSDVAAVSLQLMNVRRCGHSDSFFFVEVGRSAATGPGELWMQADDAVVAQSIHETVLEAMRAMKELCEFRPRSKSQSSSSTSSAPGGSNQVTVPTRRHHLHNQPPSRTGLPRRARTESAAATTSRGAPCRGRTASEGDGATGMAAAVASAAKTTRSGSGSPVSPPTDQTYLSRSNTVICRPCRTPELSCSSLQHSKSMCLPSSRSPPPATSPVVVPTGSANLDGISQPPTTTSGSPSDAGFISCEECSSSPADHLRHLLMAHRSSTPESFATTPGSSQDGSDLHGYMIMEKQSCGNIFQRCHGRRGTPESLGDLEKAYRKRTYSLTMPHNKRGPSQVSSVSLDEYTLMRVTYTNGGHSGRGSHAASPKITYPEDYGDIEIGSLQKSSSSTLQDDGYMPMAPQGSRTENYMPMSPMCVSSPKQIINPRTHPLTVANGYRIASSSPSSCSLDDSGYMRMLCGSRFSVESSDGKLSNSEYLNMSPVDPCVSVTPPDYFLATLGGTEQPPPLRQPCCYSSLPRCYKQQQISKNEDSDQYVLMSLQNQKIVEEPAKMMPKSAPSPLRQGRADLLHRSRMCRPTRLPLDSLRMMPSMNEHPILPPEPKSPGEYINIDFSHAVEKHSPSSTESPASSLSSSSEQRRSPLSDYMNINVAESPKSRDAAPFSPVDVAPELAACPARPEEEEDENVEVGGVKCYHLTAQVAPACKAGTTTAKDDYTEMTFHVHASPPPPLQSTPQPAECSQTTSPSSCVRRLNLGDAVGVPPVESFLLRGAATVPPVDPDRGAKVIRADPQGRRRHSSETFSSTTTVTPVFPSFAHDTRRHGSASVENVSVLTRNGELPEDEYGSPMCRETSAGFQNGLNYIALNLMDEGLASCDALVRFKAASCCKGGINAMHASPYVSLGFKETATVVKGE
ncbi:insulin receptor substrate 2 [Astyanax mexicanus]|uniref:Insulin receptor substrate 2 n=1 Tax=Astyanax mexicanus TaxID=7994 RepID=A0A8T2LJV8_ASTMX|nr:insulin receptor substrate 2 [Astyanax mexicanus]